MGIESQRRQKRELQRLLAEHDIRLQVGIGQEAVSHFEPDELKSEEATEVTFTEQEFLSPIAKYTARIKRKYAR